MQMQANAVPVIDYAKLRRQTMGDEAHQVEVLSLFIAEVERLMIQVEDATDPHLRADRLRALTALAKNVGAMRLAQEARATETQIGTDAPNLEPLRLAVSETLSHIRRAGV
jgi:hypothetical protein